MVIKIIISMMAICLATSGGCEPAINWMAFFPDKKNVISSDNLPKNVQEIYIETIDRIKIQCYLIPNTSSDKLLIYFHGNGGNIGHRLHDLMRLNSFGVTVLGVGYRGYGKSQGNPSEQGIYIDGQSTLDHAISELGYPIENIIILGRSIGTTVAVNVAQNKNIDRLILVTPLTSGKDHAKKTGLGFLSSLAGESFNNIDKIENISCPLLVIHGDQDKVIPFEMGEAMYKKAKSQKLFIKIVGAGHNNLSTAYHKSYWPPIDMFINQNELKSN